MDVRDGDSTEVHAGVENALLGGGRKYTRQQVAERVGVPVERANQLWRSLGFATVGDDEAVFTDNDVEALNTVRKLLEAGIVDEDLATSMARVVGQHLSRLAEWQVHFLHDLIGQDRGLRHDGHRFARFVDELVPELERLQNYAWRRHLAAYSGRTLALPDEDPRPRGEVVGFADMVGYTNLARRASETELSLVLERFETCVAESVADHHGRVVKMLGDEVLFVADSPGDGAEIALTLVERAEAEEALPSLRAGLAFGPVLRRFGDVYGSTVNIASRLTSIAPPRRVLVDLELAGELRAHPDYVVRPRRPVSVRGFHRLKPSLLRRASATAPS